MLVLARKKAETILIGEEIVIKVLQMRNGVVRIGIEAPSSVRVMRGEVKGVGRESGSLPPSAEPLPVQDSYQREVVVIEEQCRPAVESAPIPESRSTSQISPVVSTAAPLAAMLRALRVVPNGAEGPAVQLRSPQRN
ncbi:MAG: carbon storage regulator [Planctomycetaceae bacterium]|jgi:carbon storage regulator CsrA